MFAVLPLAIWLLARRCREQARWRSGAPLLARLAATTAVAGAAFLLSHIPIVFFGSPGFAVLVWSSVFCSVWRLRCWWAACSRFAERLAAQTG